MMQKEIVSSYAEFATHSNIKYRYLWGRMWDATLPKITFVLCNPSIADELKIDFTLTKCLNYVVDQNRSEKSKAKYGTIEVVNLYALVTPNPKELWPHKNPVGPENDEYINQSVKNAKTVVLAWGATPNLKMRATAVLDLINQNRNKLYRFASASKNYYPPHPRNLASKNMVLERFTISQYK